MKRSMKIIMSIVILIAFIATSLGLTAVAVKGIKLNASSVKISVGKTYKLKVNFSPANVTNKKVIFSSANKDIATVSSTGYIKGIKPGKTVITVTSESNEKAVAKCNVAISFQGKKYKGQIIVSINTEKKENDEGVKALIEAYNKYQPNVKVIWEGKVGADYTTWLGTQLASGNIRPDIASVNYQSTYKNVVNFDKHRFIMNPYTGNRWDQDLDFDFNVYSDYEANRSMLPTQAVHIMWYYNKDLFEKAGVTPPQDWEQFVQVCEKLKKAGIIPIATNYTYKVPQWIQNIYWDVYTLPWIELIRAQPGDYCYKENLDGKFKYDPNDKNINGKYTHNPSRFYKAIRDKKIRFDTPEMTDMVTNMAKVFPKYCTSDMFVLQDDYPVFLQQNAAMIIGTTSSIIDLTKDMKNLGDKERLKQLKINEDTTLKPFRWGTFENPSIKSSLVKGPVKSIEVGTGEYLGIIDKNQEQTNMCLDFLMFWTSKAGYQPYVDGQVKANKFRPGGKIVINGVKIPNDIKELFDGVKLMGDANSMRGLWCITVGYGSTYHTQLYDMYKQALEGKISPQDFGKGFQKLIEDNFDDILKLVGLTQDDLDHPERSPVK